MDRDTHYTMQPADMLFCVCTCSGVLVLRHPFTLAAGADMCGFEKPLACMGKDQTCGLWFDLSINNRVRQDLGYVCGD